MEGKEMFAAVDLANDTWEGDGTLVLLFKDEQGDELFVRFTLPLLDRLIAGLPEMADRLRGTVPDTTPAEVGVGMDRAHRSVVLLLSEAGSGTSGVREFRLSPPQARQFAADILTAADALEAKRH